MNKRSLSQLYRSNSGAGAKPLDADTLLALSRGERLADADLVVAELAASPLNAALLRFTRDLEAASASLSAELATTLPQDGAQHRHASVRRPAHATRRWRVAAALAASLIVAVVAWNTHVPQTSGAGAYTAQSTAQSDRIFEALDDAAVASRGDEIFRAQFLSDEIFSTKTHGG